VLNTLLAMSHSAGALPRSFAQVPRHVCRRCPHPAVFTGKWERRVTEQRADLESVAGPFVQGFVSVFARSFAGFQRLVGADGAMSRIAGERNCRHLCASSSSEHDVNLSTSTPLAILSVSLALGANTIATAPATQRQSTDRPRIGSRA
jgi:hypothetical protein